MFGWERQINETIAEKREEELTWIWRRKLLDFVNNVVKSVPSRPRTRHLIPCTVFGFLS
jgi:hypothetical protein